MQDLMTFLEESRLLVDKALETYLPAETTEPHTLHRAMRYSIFAGGKRIRPALVIAASDLHHGKRETVLPAGVSTAENASIASCMAKAQAVGRSADWSSNQQVMASPLKEMTLPA